jgi:hypothetical protein
MTADEIERAMMRAAHSALAQILVNRLGQPAIGEKEHFRSSTNFGFAEELGRSGWCWGSHVDRFCHHD